jgi:hypothetical protein
VGRFARNEPCPCGSGVKFKRCCIGRERELERREDALEVLVWLGTLFPLMRPCGGELEPWLVEHATHVPDWETINDGIARLTEDEGLALIDAYVSRYPGVWRGLVEDVSGLDTAESVLLAGAFAATLREWREPEPLRLALIAETEDPAEALALALDGTNLWSVVDATLLDELLAALDQDLDEDAYTVVWDATVERLARRLCSDAHARRLDVLVERIVAWSSTHEDHAAAPKLRDACAAFARDEHVRARVAALLLSDTIEPLSPLTHAAAA